MAYKLASLVAKGRTTRRKQVALRPFKTPVTLGRVPADIGKAIVREWREAVRTKLLPMMTAGGLVRDDVSGVEEFFEREGDRITGLVLALTPSLRRWVVEVERWHRRRWSASIQSATGLSVEDFLLPFDRADEIQASLREASGLIRSIDTDTRKRIERLTYNAVTQQLSRRELARDLNMGLGIERRRALTIARDQTTKLAGTLDRLRNQEAGIEEYEWVHSGKVNFRQEHLDRDGKRFRWDNPPSDGHPGFAINCGCTSRAVLDLE